MFWMGKAKHKTQELTELFFFRFVCCHLLPIWIEDQRVIFSEPKLKIIWLKESILIFRMGKALLAAK